MCGLLVDQSYIPLGSPWCQWLQKVYFHAFYSVHFISSSSSKPGLSSLCSVYIYLEVHWGGWVILDRQGKWFFYLCLNLPTCRFWGFWICLLADENLGQRVANRSNFKILERRQQYFMLSPHLERPKSFIWKITKYLYNYTHALASLSRVLRTSSSLTCLIIYNRERSPGLFQRSRGLFLSGISLDYVSMVPMLCFYMFRFSTSLFRCCW